MSLRLAIGVLLGITTTVYVYDESFREGTNKAFNTITTFFGKQFSQEETQEKTEETEEEQNYEQ